MSTIFISHSSKDNALARELERRLAEQNHASVFLDLDPEKGIVAGQSWERTLYRKLRACRAVIVLCTDSYLASHWCFAEIALARMEGKQILALQVDPLGPDAKMPSILTEKQYIDLRPDPEDGYRRLWRGLREMDLLGVSNEWDPKQSPYPGLNAYEEKHAPVFFGREDETRAGIELLDRGAPGLIMVLGASGSGKSSIVRAGMVPRLRRSGDRWLVVGPFRPRRDPFAELAESFVEAFQRYAPGRTPPAVIRERVQALRPAETTPALPAAGSVPEDLEPVPNRATDERLSRLVSQLQDLRRSPPPDGGAPLLEFLDWSLDDLREICGEKSPLPRPEKRPPETSALIGIADDLRRASGQSEARVLLVIDQFEELLGDEATDDEAARCLTILRNALETEHSPVMALGTMRSDFLGLFQRNSALLGMDFESLSVGPLSVDGMRRVIEEPSRLSTVELEKGLADRLLEDTGTPDALPLLSYTMSVLWRDGRADGLLEIREYENLGGLQGAISREAEAILNQARRQNTENDVRRAFLQMARLTEDGAYAKLPVSWDREEIQKVRPILTEFERRRLLVTRMEPGEQRTVEVAHEALFRSWAPLRAWLDNHRGELLLLAQVRRDARAWEENSFAAENLWHGGRLQQAAELMRRGKLSDGEKDPGPEGRFIRAGVRRRRIRRGALVAVTLLVFAVLSVFLVIARNARLTAEASEKQARRLNYVANMNVAAQARMPGRVNQILSSFLPETTDPTADLRTFCWYYLWHQNHDELATLTGHTEYVNAVVFSPDGKMLASAGEDQTVRLWDAGTRQELNTLTGHSKPVYAIAFAPDGRMLASASLDGTVKLWETTGRVESVHLNGHSTPVYSVAFSPDGRTLASADSDGTVKLWDTVGGQELAGLTEHTNSVWSVTFSPDGRQLASASQDQTVRLWDVAERRVLATLKGHEGAIYSVAFSPDGKTLASASDDKTVRIWDSETGLELIILERREVDMYAVAFSPDGKILATASLDGTVKLWDTGTREELATLRGHSSPIWYIAFSPDGKTLATASEDYTVKLWDTGTRESPAPLPVHSKPVNSVAFSPDGKTLASASNDQTIKLWDTGTRQELPPLPENGGAVKSVAFSPDGKTLASAGADQIIKLWDMGTRQESASLSGNGGAVNSVVFSPDGKMLASGSDDRTVKLWSATTGQLLKTFDGHGDPVESVAFSPDGKMLASAGADLLVKLWDITTGRELTTFTGHKDTVNSVAFSPDGNTLVSASWDKTVRVWDIRTRQKLAILKGHSSYVYAVAFSPDGNTLASTSWDETVKLWDTGIWQELATLRSHTRPVYSVAFSPDGRLLVSAGEDQTVKFWLAATDQKVEAQKGEIISGLIPPTPGKSGIISNQNN